VKIIEHKDTKAQRFLRKKHRKHLFCKTSVTGTDVPIDVQLHPANKFASAAEHPPAALKGLPLQKREYLKKLLRLEGFRLLLG
jgi:hypothetical protein